ncbi:immunity 49 family protein [Streptomyces sp. NPDC007259]|uniref:immunity 49 family protein n=1 Tax=Streptomyces sp. NPDC007259 TaxID=3154319 RepID=UPI0034534D73
MNHDDAGAAGHTPTIDELLRGTHARLLPTDSLTPEIAGALRYARVVADGLVFGYALDAPTSVRILTDPDVERVGVEKLGEAAYANLMRTPVEHELVDIGGRATLHSVYGDSHFVASNALFLSELSRRVTGRPLPEAGALVVVPTRHLLAFHPITDGSVVDAVNDLAAYALGAYEDGPGRLSPQVYWWHRGGLTSLTVIDEDSRTFSLRPPSELLGLMKGLAGLDRAGRLPGSAAASDIDALTRATAGALAHAPAGLEEAFAPAVALSHAHCATDPELARVEGWNAWATALQLGTALFTGAQAQKYYLGEETEGELPAMAAAPPADARAWLDAFYLSLVCRDRQRSARLCRVPLVALRADEGVDPYVLHWIDTLQSYWCERPGDEVVEKLVATMQTSAPEALTLAPKDFVNLVDYQPAALFHRLFTRDHGAFAEALDEAVAHHGSYWGDSTAPRARVALGPLALACLAYDQGFPVTTKRPFLPGYLLDGQRVEVMPAP